MYPWLNKTPYLWTNFRHFLSTVVFSVRNRTIGPSRLETKLFSMKPSFAPMFLLTTWKFQLDVSIHCFLRRRRIDYAQSFLCLVPQRKRTKHLHKADSKLKFWRYVQKDLCKARLYTKMSGSKSVDTEVTPPKRHRSICCSKTYQTAVSANHLWCAVFFSERMQS